MVTLKVKNLDQLYSTIKSEVGNLNIIGWSAIFEGVEYSGAPTLMKWFFNNIKKLKEGVVDLEVAYAVADGNGYSWEGDVMAISTTPTPLGLLVVLTTIKYYENGAGSYAGNYKSWSETKKQIFLMEIVEE